MKILMRSTVFKTAVLPGLLLCALALAGAFSGITASVHAINAGDVDTEEELKQFVEEAVVEYYAGFLLKKRCDLTKLDLPQMLENAIPTSLGTLGLSTPIQDLSPASIGMLTVEDIKELIDLFADLVEQGFLPGGINLWEGSDPPCVPPPASSFRQVFMPEVPADERWNSGSVYLFVAQYDPQSREQKIIFHGRNSDLEDQDLRGLEDKDGNEIMDLIERAADGTVEGRTEEGFLDYCWDDPTTDGDDLPDDGNPLTAPGASWKTSYVVDPFMYLGMPAPLNSPRVIFGSGIYPKTGDWPSPASECDGGELRGESAGSVGGGGGGCAIAAGSGNTLRSSALNLLLIVSALFFTISLRGRATDK